MPPPPPPLLLLLLLLLTLLRLGLRRCRCGPWCLLSPRPLVSAVG
jgi:hypothetical protein